MSGPFNIGDVVVCVDVEPRHWHTAEHAAALSRLKIHSLYRVSGLGKVGQNSGPSIFLHGVEAAAEWDGFGWITSRFQHLPKADEQFTEQMRALKPLKVRA